MNLLEKIHLILQKKNTSMVTRILVQYSQGRGGGQGQQGKKHLKVP